MASRVIIVHPDAENEYLTSLEWYRGLSLSAAINFEAEVSLAIARIHQAPERWPDYFSVCKRYILSQFPFSIVYRIQPARIIVLAIAHGHRRPGYWKARLPWDPEHPLRQR